MAANLNSVLREGLGEKVTTEQRAGGRGRASPGAIWGQSLPGARNRTGTGQGKEHAWSGQGLQRRPAVGTGCENVGCIEVDSEMGSVTGSPSGL